MNTLTTAPFQKVPSGWRELLPTETLEKGDMFESFETYLPTKTNPQWRNVNLAVGETVAQSLLAPCIRKVSK